MRNRKKDNSKEEKNENYSREWTISGTIYILLKYKKWQLKDRKKLTLKQFQIECCNDLYTDLGIQKTPVQVRDKINNTRSSYYVLKKQIENKKNKTSTTPTKIENEIFLNKRILNIMDTLYNKDCVVTVEEIETKIFELVQNHRNRRHHYD